MTAARRGGIASPALTIRFSIACVSHCGAMPTAGSSRGNCARSVTRRGTALRSSGPVCAHHCQSSVTPPCSSGSRTPSGSSVSACSPSLRLCRYATCSRMARMCARVAVRLCECSIASSRARTGSSTLLRSCPRPAASVPSATIRSASCSRRCADASARVCSMIRSCSRVRSSTESGAVSISRLTSRTIPMKNGAECTGSSARDIDSSMATFVPSFRTASNRRVRVSARAVSARRYRSRYRSSSERRGSGINTRTFCPKSSVGVHPKTCSTESLAERIIPLSSIVMIGLINAAATPATAFVSPAAALPPPAPPRPRGLPPGLPAVRSS